MNIKPSIPSSKSTLQPNSLVTPMFSRSSSVREANTNPFTACQAGKVAQTPKQKDFLRKKIFTSSENSIKQNLFRSLFCFLVFWLKNAKKSLPKKIQKPSRKPSKSLVSQPLCHIQRTTRHLKAGKAKPEFTPLSFRGNLITWESGSSRTVSFSVAKFLSNLWLEMYLRYFVVDPSFSYDSLGTRIRRTKPPAVV